MLPAASPCFSARCDNDGRKRCVTEGLYYLLPAPVNSLTPAVPPCSLRRSPAASLSFVILFRTLLPFSYFLTFTFIFFFYSTLSSFLFFIISPFLRFSCFFAILFCLLLSFFFSFSSLLTASPLFSLVYYCFSSFSSLYLSFTSHFLLIVLPQNYHLFFLFSPFFPFFLPFFLSSAFSVPRLFLLPFFPCLSFLLFNFPTSTIRSPHLRFPFITLLPSLLLHSLFSLSPLLSPLYSSLPLLSPPPIRISVHFFPLASLTDYPLFSLFHSILFFPSLPPSIFNLYLRLPFFSSHTLSFASPLSSLLFFLLFHLLLSSFHFLPVSPPPSLSLSLPLSTCVPACPHLSRCSSPLGAPPLTPVCPS